MYSVDHKILTYARANSLSNFIALEWTNNFSRNRAFSRWGKKIDNKWTGKWSNIGLLDFQCSVVYLRAINICQTLAFLSQIMDLNRESYSYYSDFMVWKKKQQTNVIEYESENRRDCVTFNRSLKCIALVNPLRDHSDGDQIACRFNTLLKSWRIH